MGISPALAKKIADAKTSVSGNRIKDGEYELLVRKIICESKYKGTMFIVEFDVVDSAPTHEKIAPNAPGTECSVAFSLDAPGPGGDAAKSNAKQFLLGLLGLEDGEADFMEKLVEYCDDDQPGRGMLVNCATYRKTINSGKNAGTEGCYPRFAQATEGNSDKEIAARRKKLDADKR